MTREEKAEALAKTHLLSIWPLTEMGEFADSVPDYQSELMPEAEAAALYKRLDYTSTAQLTPFEADEWCPAYLLSLDKLDEGGDPVCQEGRNVYAPTPPASLQ